jgi:hypothetical protein
MISTDNINIIKKMNSRLWEFIKASEATIAESDVTLVPAKNGDPTLMINRGGAAISLHSSYDPRREAEAFISSISDEEMEKHNHVFFYGVGLGYHVEAFVRRFPHVFVTLIEPDKHVFCHFLSRFDLGLIPRRYLRNIYLANTTEELEGVAADFFNRNTDAVFFVTLPSYERAFSEEFDQFKKFFVNSIHISRSNRATRLNFEKRWTINSMLNFIPSLRNKDIFNVDSSNLVGKPAILVAAGPALEDEIENLRRIKEEGSAYIFTVGSAIKALINNGIKPDAAAAMDPGEYTQFTFAEIIERKITDIPLIYGTSVGFEVLQQYPGPKLHMTMDRDTVSPYFIRHADGSSPLMVNDAPTIAITTLQLLTRLGFDPIILVGQSLGFRDGQNYAKGIAYTTKTISRDHMAMQHELAGATEVEDVYGGKVLSSTIYNIFRRVMEALIASAAVAYQGKRHIINTTRGGAAIKGTEFKHLDELLAEGVLKDRIVVDKWYEAGSKDLDTNYLLNREERMTRSLEKLKNYLDHAEQLVIELANKFEYRRSRQLELLFQDLDKTMGLITKNDFFKVFLSPLNQMETLVFAGGFADVHATLDIGEKARLVSRGVGKYILECKRDIAFITDQLYPLIQQHIGKLVESGRAGEPSLLEEIVLPPEMLENLICTDKASDMRLEENDQNSGCSTGVSVC